jgi:GNAT superfamily N-acetyltransferase
VIEPPEEADIPALVGLLEDLDRFYGVTDFPPADVRAALVREALFGSPPAAAALVARRGDKLVAVATYSFHWPTTGLRSSLFLKDLFVAERYRGDGVGEELMRELRAIATARGCSRVEWTADSWNDGALRFYERLGARAKDRPFYRWDLADQPHDGAAYGNGSRQAEHDRQHPGRLPRGVHAADQKPGHRDQADDGDLLGHDAEA